MKFLSYVIETKPTVPNVNKNEIENFILLINYIKFISYTRLSRVGKKAFARSKTLFRTLIHYFFKLVPISDSRKSAQISVLKILFL